MKHFQELARCRQNGRPKIILEVIRSLSATTNEMELKRKNNQKDNIDQVSNQKKPW